MISFGMAARRLRRTTASLVVAATLGLAASCGGDTEQIDPFVAERYFAFGDESSLLLPGGRKYTVNALNADGSLDCSNYFVWTQQLASLYGFVFEECNPGNVVAPRAKMYAQVNATVADVAAQVDAQVAAGGFRDKDLSTVMAGANDILELYNQYPQVPESTLQNEARARGARLALIVNRLVALGSKVVLANTFDMGLTPYGLAQQALHTDTDRSALLSRLSQTFNEQLGVKILLDGRFIGLVQADLAVQTVYRSPGSYGFANASEVVCSVPLPLCDTSTVIAGRDPVSYFWSDGIHLSPGGQQRLGNLAVDRARGNPF